jgi:putative spermidine/putrescine transport system permease protein
MPFTYRALDAGLRAIDLRTLVDASRSCGAGWATTMFRVLVPNLRSSLLTSAFLTATVVMGEFTMAALMGKPTLPAFTQAFYELEPQGGLALGLLTLVVTTALLAFVTFLTRRRGGAAVTAGI